MTWKIKKNAETNEPEISDDGKITYIDPEGKELPLDPPSMYQKIIDLGSENSKHRKKKNEVIERFGMFKDIEDLDEWKKEADKAIDAVSNFKDKDWMKVDKVDKLKKEMSDAYEEKLRIKDVSFADREKENGVVVEGLNKQIRKLMVSNNFSTSKHFNGNDSITILPANIAEDHFGKHFLVEEDANKNLVTKAYYSNGDIVLSKTNPGEPAEFEEAIGLIIDKYPGREGIVRASKGGSGGSGGSGGGNEDVSDIANLKKQLSQAHKDGNAKLAIVLKNRLFKATQNAM